MAGPCPNGRPTQETHKEAKCRDRESCTGTGCRVQRATRRDPLPAPDESTADSL